MTKFEVHKNRAVMVVTPAPHLMHSSLIADVVKRGRKFVVDLETGVLSIQAKHTHTEYVTTIPKIKYFTGKTAREVVLSRDLECALDTIVETSLHVPSFSVCVGYEVLYYNPSTQYRFFKRLVEQVYKKHF
jgi:hypothetical protein